MANKKISQLTAAVTPLTGTELLPVVQGGITLQTTAQDIADLGGGSSGVVEVTYTALQTLISNSELSPGAMYKITGFNKNMPNGGPSNPNGYLPVVLYDDGTNSGITIYMQALTTNTLSSDGYGEFYNPIYEDQTTYENTDGTGLYGIWDGDNPDPLEVPAYTIDQVVFWGGYAWKNLAGNVGTADNVITLNSDDWEKLPYSNTTYYELVIDEVKVDWNNEIVIGRTNIENQITVEFNADQYDWWMGLYDDIRTNPISVMGWGLYSKITPEQLDNQFYGISNLHIINSNCETVNFKGAGLLNIDMDSSYFYNNYIGRGCYIDEIIIRSFSSIRNNILTINSYIYSNTLEHNGYIDSNTLTINSNITTNTLTNGGNIYNNTLTNISYISNNTLTNNSYINNNTLTNSSNINNNTLTNSSYINNNTLTNGSYINNNTLTNDSYINNNTLTASNISITLNTLTFSTFSSFNNIVNNIRYNNVNNSPLSGLDLGTATHMYATYYKQIFNREDGTFRLGYYNNSDVFTVVAPNS